MNEQIILEKFSERLFKLIKDNNTDINMLAKILGIKSKSTIYRYMNGEMSPKITTIKCLAEYFNVDATWLMGYDVPMDPIKSNDTSNKKITILGTVKAGYNWLAEENVIGYITDRDTIKDYEKNINEYFALKVTGDSMLPLLSDGDLVIVHDQDDVESGQTAIILINGEEATVKKVIKTNEGIELHAMNPYYPIKKFTFDDMKNIPIKIIGRVKEAKIKGAFE